MAFSLKKRSQSKPQIYLNSDDQSKSLGAVLHRSTKTKKKNNNLLYPDENSPSPSSDLRLKTPSTPSNEIAIIYRSRCLCDTHYDKQLVERNYDLTVDKLFDLLFGSNEFVRTYRKAQRFYDDTATEWITNEQTNHRERILNYKVPYESTFIGKGTIFTREKQILFHEAPGSHYMLQTEVCNKGVKFSDTFALTIRYCLVQTSFTTTNLRVTAQIVYIEPVNSFIKPIIERNAYSASQEGLKDLNNRLNLITDFKMERRLSRSEMTLVVPVPELVRRLSEPNLHPVHQLIPTDNHTNIRSSESDKIIYIVLFLLGILIVIHIYLCMKLKDMALLVDNLAHLSNI